MNNPVLLLWWEHFWTVNRIFHVRLAFFHDNVPVFVSNVENTDLNTLIIRHSHVQSVLSFLQSVFPIVEEQTTSDSDSLTERRNTVAFSVDFATF